MKETTETYISLAKSTLIGAALGFAASVALIFLGFACDFISCACSIITCDFDSSASMTGAVLNGFGSICFFCVICGAIIGFVYGRYKEKEKQNEQNRRTLEEQSEEAKRQRQKWASEIKQKALNVNNICSKNKTNFKEIVSTNYTANTQMDKIMAELSNLSEKQGKVDSIIEELTKKGGTSR